MRCTMQNRLRAAGCRSVPDVSQPRSFGLGFLLLKRRISDRKENARPLSRREAEMQERRYRRTADIERLKQLGGTTRSPAENREFAEIILRNPCVNTAHFEKRLWERPTVPATFHP